LAVLVEFGVAGRGEPALDTEDLLVERLLHPA